MKVHLPVRISGNVYYYYACRLFTTGEYLRELLDGTTEATS